MDTHTLRLASHPSSRSTSKSPRSQSEHAIHLLSRSYAYDDDPYFENGDFDFVRPSALDQLKSGASQSETESYPDVDEPAELLSRSTSRRSILSCLRSASYAWARRLRTGSEEISNGSIFTASKRRRRRRPLNIILLLLALSLMLLGVIQFLSVALSVFVAFFPDDLDWVMDHWGDAGTPSEGLDHWPTDFTGDIKPVACHSHNDYWRKVPLFSAINAGCIGVEADVWLYDGELYVGHNTYALTPKRTLKSLYINPLLDILDKQNPTTGFATSAATPRNGVFDTDPSQTLILLIDFKTSGPDLWPYVSSQLEPFRQRGYLTHINGTSVNEGPITIVGTGNTPFDMLVANSTYRDIFFDAPLDQMAGGENDWDAPQPESITTSPDDNEEDVSYKRPTRRAVFGSGDAGQGRSGGAPLDSSIYDPTNSYYASVSFKKSVGHVWRSRLSADQLDLVREQIKGAHKRGLKVRYWDVPSWPRGLRNHIWHVLTREGVDILNVDDLVGATRRDWRRRKGWWY